MVERISWACAWKVDVNADVEAERWESWVRVERRAERCERRA